MVGDKSQPFWCFLFPPRSLSSSLRKFSELLKRCRGLLGSLAPRLRQEDEDEDEAKETDAAVEEEGGSVAKRVLQIKKRQDFKHYWGTLLYELGLPAGPGKSW